MGNPLDFDPGNSSKSIMNKLKKVWNALKGGDKVNGA